MSKNTFICGDKIYLRAIEAGDEELICRIENHPEIRTTLFYFRPVTIEEQKDKINNLIRDNTIITFIICNKCNDNSIGQVSLVRIDWVSRTAIYYIAIADKENHAKGFGFETTNIIIDYAFNTLNLNRIQLHVALENEGAIKVYKKCGFQIEGILREAMFHNGKYSDFYVMGILRSDREVVK